MKVKASPAKTVNIGLIGLGVVGSGVVKVLKKNARAIERRTGIRLVLKKIAVQSLAKKRLVRVPRRLLTTRPGDILGDPSIDIVVELIGGLRPAKEIIRKAFENGKQVVTANKALLAEQGEEIFGAAARCRKKLGFEASVCGGIPIVKALKEGLASNQISHFLGIVNGTCNTILTAMSQRGVGFDAALKEAQVKGYAEKNPHLDVDGIDSAHKLAILARLGFRSRIAFRDIHVEGIRPLSIVDIEYAKELGYAVKLLAIGKNTERGMELRVHPTMLPFDHPLSGVKGVYNAVFVHADQAGDLLFYGKGAGMLPTASAVMSDILDIAKRISGQVDLKSSAPIRLTDKKVLAMEEIASKYYLRFQVEDKPGVLGKIARTLGKNHISILSVHQKESHDPRSVPVIILTYEAKEKNIRKALSVINRDRVVREKTVMVRVEA
ncbi:MAG: homoserine dehydrogenase [Candidatus Omnitrophica bacterium]|nr:homoserine dehydrogenase [Candidatus Omnitrophota bacterium]